MKTKDELKDELDTLLRQLDRKYFQPRAAGIPSADDLDRVTTLITALGKAIGKKYFGLTHFWGLAKAVDKYYGKKLGIKDFFDKLVDKLVSLPKGPLTQIRKLLEAGGASDAKQLTELAELIEGYDPNKDYTKIDWAFIYPTILPFTTDEFRSMLSSAKDNYHFETDLRLQAFRKFYGWAAFADVQMQRLSWKLKYENAFKEAASCVYILQNPEYDQRLRDAYCGDWATFEEFKKSREKAGVRDRQRRRRAKKRD